MKGRLGLWRLFGLRRVVEQTAFTVQKEEFRGLNQLGVGLSFVSSPLPFPGDPQWS